MIMMKEEITVLHKELDMYIKYCDDNGLSKAKEKLKDLKVKMPFIDYAKSMGFSSMEKIISEMNLPKED